MLEIGDDVWDAMQAARYARRGAWPRDGGTLNQTAAFLDACQIIIDDEDTVRAELKLEALDG